MLIVITSKIFTTTGRTLRQILVLLVTVIIWEIRKKAVTYIPKRSGCLMIVFIQHTLLFRNLTDLH